ncbi:Rieske 2Fe-2S domain-containing protein [Ramlibacter ginsenosidimutans]|uniref:Rieske 2Fe-2S domain-containing protein n=1 Tax=Ramlibacter ginsenosidimutans TaxID=502333 RepID=A0A934TUS9_9BURK|nr:Rieske 2Fe-2S domain-containing protein [Ramlibacter ginsenosidimutans]MBK6007147.1 Rieske 2Fe-2S domain-containing protein [Ramlibacter ginsenosidimutans]
MMDRVPTAGSKDDGVDAMCRVMADTPMGQALRRFWMPALLASELVADGEPVRLRLLGENLIAFRDTTGAVGIVDAYCAHKRAPLFFGRNEHSGLRCVYHGWKYDVSGRCLEIPNVDQQSLSEAMLNRVGLKAYETAEAGGVVWVYMGPKSEKPDLPNFDWLALPSSHVHVSRWIQRSNWVQFLEGEFDSSHVSYLHKSAGVGENLTQAISVFGADGAPHLFVRPTGYGFYTGARRDLGDRHYWRMTHYMQPVWSSTSSGVPEDRYFNGRGACPIDDYNTSCFVYRYRLDRPLDERDFEELNNGSWFPPRREKAALALEDGYVIDTFLPTANRGNDYLISRELQRTSSFTGIHGFNTQDRAVQEGMPWKPGGRMGLADRSGEHLVAADAPTVAFRRQLMKMAKDMSDGLAPPAASKAELFSVRGFCAYSGKSDFDEFVAENPTLMSRAPVVPR